MHLEEFAHGSSLAHKLDPRAKIISAVLLSFAAALADKTPVLFLFLAGSIVLLLLARLPVIQVARRLAVVNVFIVFIWFFLPFSYPGRPVFDIGPFTATREGIWYALNITIKSNAILLVIISLLTTSPVFALVHALRHLYVPDKLVNLFFFTFRYFQVIHQEYHRLRDAMRVRCFHGHKTSMHTYRSLSYLVGMLLVRSFDRSERVYQAMLCRGYKGRFWILDHFSIQRRDLVFLGFVLCYVSGLAVLQWTNLIY